MPSTPGKLTAWAAALKMNLQIVARRQPHAFEVLPRRWVVERTFAWISKHRRTVRDYERLPASHEAMILWAMTALRGLFASLCPCCRSADQVDAWALRPVGGPGRALIARMSERKRYPSDLTDERWALIEPVITAWKAADRLEADYQRFTEEQPKTLNAAERGDPGPGR